MTSSPQPAETPTNQPMLAAWRERGALALQRCADCRRTAFYPRSLCPHCWSSKLDWFEAEGAGRIVSFSHVHRGLPECFAADAPVVLAEIELPEGISMIARVIAPDPAQVHAGMQLRLLDPADASRYALPTFRPLPA